MAHTEQKAFFEYVKKKFPYYFSNVIVLDCGSLDINGSLEELFTNSAYIGLDIVPGKNVDIVWSAATFRLRNFDVVISGEMLEHSESYQEDIKNMTRMVRSGGLLAISAAGEGREEHGTVKTGSVWGTSPDYYRNIIKPDFDLILDQFSEYEINENTDHHDIYFWGIKK